MQSTTARQDSHMIPRLRRLPQGPPVMGTRTCGMMVLGILKGGSLETTHIIMGRSLALDTSTAEQWACGIVVFLFYIEHGQRTLEISILQTFKFQLLQKRCQTFKFLSIMILVTTIN